MADIKETVKLDALIVGAGFAGIHMLWKLRQKGFQAMVAEAEDDVGGCWYANRYPGARCDVESVAYSYSFSDIIEGEWSWSERYPQQQEIQRYLAFVADRLDLRNSIDFSTRITEAVFNETSNRWRVTCDRGASYDVKYLILASGPLTVPKLPDIPGRDTFEGESFHTARWPKSGIDLSGKVVGLIGTGSSGTQLIPAVVDQVEKLYVFVRTPNYVTPARNRQLSADDRRYWREYSTELRGMASRAELGGGGDVLSFESLRNLRGLDFYSLSGVERLDTMETCWTAGGPAPLIYAFKDVYSDPVVNQAVSDFIISKIGDVIVDDDLRETLTPTGYPFLAKRPTVADGYYESFLRPNVTAVNVRRNPLVRIGRTGVELADGSAIALDVIVYASGFDAMTGALFAIDIRGRDDQALAASWFEGPVSYLGLSVYGFPNMFIVGGPGSPSVLTNVVPTNEFQVNYLSDLLERSDAREAYSIEPSLVAQTRWARHCVEIASRTLMNEADSWYVGANVPGKPRVVLPYTGGIVAYQQACLEETATGYASFVARRADGSLLDPEPRPLQSIRAG